MRNKRFFVVLVGALLFGLLAAFSVSRYLSSAQAYTKNLSSVAVAKVAIPIGTKIKVVGFQAKDGSLRASSRDLEFPDGRRVTQLIPYRNGGRLLAFQPDD